MKVFFILLFIFLNFSCREKSGEISLNKEVFDFGNTFQGQVNMDSVVVKNIGGSIVDLSIFADCGCTILEDGFIKLNPGEIQTVKFNFNPKNFGFVQQKIILESSNKKVFKIILLRANVNLPD